VKKMDEAKKGEIALALVRAWAKKEFDLEAKVGYVSFITGVPREDLQVFVKDLAKELFFTEE